jgi:hypothetical protein
MDQPLLAALPADMARSDPDNRTDVARSILSRDVINGVDLMVWLNRPRQLTDRFRELAVCLIEQLLDARTLLVAEALPQHRAITIDVHLDDTGFFYHRGSQGKGWKPEQPVVLAAGGAGTIIVPITRRRPEGWDPQRHYVG